MSRAWSAAEAVAGLSDNRPSWAWIAEAFATQGVILDAGDFAPNTPLHEAMLSSAGMRHPVQCNKSRAAAEDLIVRLRSVRSLVETWAAEYQNDASSDPGPRKARPHLGLIHRLKMFDADTGQWDYAGAYAPGLIGFLDDLARVEKIAAEALQVGKQVAGKGRPPNLHYDEFRKAVHLAYVQKTGRHGVKVNGEPDGPFVEIMRQLEARLPVHMRPAGANTGARLAKKRN